MAKFSVIEERWEFDGRLLATKLHRHHHDERVNEEGETLQPAVTDGVAIIPNPLGDGVWTLDVGCVVRHYYRSM